MLTESEGGFWIGGVIMPVSYDLLWTANVSRVGGRGGHGLYIYVSEQRKENNGE